MHQSGGDVVVRLCSGLGTDFKYLVDETIELARDVRHGMPVLGEGGLVVFLGPADQSFVQSAWPAEKGALDAHREGQGDIGHQFHLAARECASH